MNIEQIKKDMDNGVMISKVTVVNLVEAALMMKQELQLQANEGVDNASECLERVDFL